MASQVFQWRWRTLYTCPNPPEPIFSQLPNSLSSKVFSNPMVHGEPLSRAILLLRLLLSRRPPGTAVRSAAAATARPGESGVTGRGGNDGGGVTSWAGPAPPSRPRRRGELGATSAIGARWWPGPGCRYPGPSPSRSALLGPSEAARMSPGPGQRLVSGSCFSWHLQRADPSPRVGSPAAPLLSAGSWGTSRVAAAPKPGSGGAARVS